MKQKYPGFRYEGGKLLLRDWVMPFVPRSGSLYVEPFAGRGNVFWMAYCLKRYDAWWLNDIRTMSFYEAIRTVDLYRIPSNVSVEEKQYWQELRLAGDDLAIVMEPVLIRGGRGIVSIPGIQRADTFQADMLDSSGKRMRPYNADEYRSRVKRCKEILGHPSVNVTSLDYRELPWTKWDESVFVYLDPPYKSAVTMRAYNPSDVNHDEMVEILRKTKARWLLSEYYEKTYTDTLGIPISFKKKREGMTTSVGSNVVAQVRVECLYASKNLRKAEK